MTARRTLLGLFALGLAATLASAPASAQGNYPNKPIRWLVGYVPGGTTDILARLIGQYLSEKIGQQFIIENKAGANGSLGAAQVARAAPEVFRAAWTAKK